jgi:acyl dehydratase
VIPGTDRRALGNALLLLRKTLDAHLVPLWRRLGDSDPPHFDPHFAKAQELGDTVVHGRFASYLGMDDRWNRSSAEPKTLEGS